MKTHLVYFLWTCLGFVQKAVDPPILQGNSSCLRNKHDSLHTHINSQLHTVLVTFIFLRKSTDDVTSVNYTQRPIVFLIKTFDNYELSVCGQYLIYVCIKKTWKYCLYIIISQLSDYSTDVFIHAARPE